MKSKEILEGLGFIDERFIAEATSNEYKEKSTISKIVKFAIPLVASVMLLLLLFPLFKSELPHTTPTTDITFPPAQNERPSDFNQKEYSLFFNNGGLSATENSLHIEGHFSKPLSSEEIEILLPLLSPKYEIESQVDYSSKNNVAKVFFVYSNLQIADNQSATLFIAPSEIGEDTFYDLPVLSEIEGVSVEAYAYSRSADIESEKDYVYVSKFKIDNIYYFIEFVSENEVGEDVFTSIVADIILGGKADFSIFDNPVIPDFINQ